jgi:hypothetical protein
MRAGARADAAVWTPQVLRHRKLRGHAQADACRRRARWVPDRSVPAAFARVRGRAAPARTRRSQPVGRQRFRAQRRWRVQQRCAPDSLLPILFETPCLRIQSDSNLYPCVRPHGCVLFRAVCICVNVCMGMCLCVCARACVFVCLRVRLRVCLRACMLCM